MIGTDSEILQHVCPNRTPLIRARILHLAEPVPEFACIIQPILGEREIREKIDALTVPKGVSVRACLIYLGELDPAVEESGFFSAVVQAKDVLRG